MLMIPKVAILGTAGVLSIVAIVILKLSLDQKDNNHNKMKIDRVEKRSQLKSLFFSLILRFTFIEIFIVRKARFKIQQFFALSIIALINLIIQNSYFWVWIVGTIITLSFIISEIYSEGLIKNVDCKQKQKESLRWRKLIIYSSCTLVSILINFAIAYRILFDSQLNLQYWGRNIGLSVGCDQIISKPIFTFIFCIILKEWEPLHALKFKYDEIENLQNANESDVISLNVEIESTKIENNSNNNTHIVNNQTNLMSPFKTEYYMLEPKSTVDRTKNPSLLEESLQNNNNNMKQYLHSESIIDETPRINSKEDINDHNRLHQKLEQDILIGSIKKRNSRFLKNTEQILDSIGNNQIVEYEKQFAQEKLKQEFSSKNIEKTSNNYNKRNISTSSFLQNEQFHLEKIFQTEQLQLQQKNIKDFEKNQQKYQKFSNSILFEAKEEKNQESNNNKINLIVPSDQYCFSSIIPTQSKFGKQKQNNKSNIYYFEEQQQHNNQQKDKNKYQNKNLNSLFSEEKLQSINNCDEEVSGKSISLTSNYGNGLILSNFNLAQQRQQINYSLMNTIEVSTTQQSRNKKNTIKNNTLEESPIKIKKQDNTSKNSIERRKCVKRSHPLSNFEIVQVAKDLEQLTEQDRKQNENDHQDNQNFADGYHHPVEGKGTLCIKLNQLEYNVDLEQLDLNSPLKKRKAVEQKESPEKNKISRSPQKIEKISQHKKIQKIKRVKNSRRKDLDTSQHMGIPNIPLQSNKSNNENACPEIYLEDF